MGVEIVYKLLPTAPGSMRPLQKKRPANIGKKMNNALHISYVINESDEIIFVNDAWSEFALANDAPELVANKVLNCNLWDFISDAATREIYQKLVDKARAGHSSNFGFRCDSPDLRRFLEMKITLVENKNIQFDTRIINTEKRICQNVFQNDARRTNVVIVACSWCKKVETGDGNWCEVEEFLSDPNLLESENISQISHGMCVSCYQSISKNHRDIFEGKIGVNNAGR